MTEKQRITILGAGFAGLETAFLLRAQLGEQAAITVVAERDAFTFRPNSIYVPFGADPDRLVVPLAKAFRRRQVDFVAGRVAGVDASAREVVLDDDRRIGWDRLVIATGAAMRPEEVPGLAEHAASIWTPAGMLDVRARFAAVRDAARAGERKRVLFLVPPNNKCAGPLYELGLMFDTWLRRAGVRDRVEIGWSTFEDSYVQAFGPRLHALVLGEFARRGIDGATGQVVAEVTPEEVRCADGTARPYDHLIAFPPYVAAVGYDGLPSDDRGFLRADARTRQLPGMPEIYAPGDAGDFPVKQAFLAFLQADAVADHIASEAGAHAFERPFDPVSMCIMEMFDQATFAQVPLALTGDPAHPVQVRPDADGDYRVGTGRTWRLGKKALGTAVPLRFRSGEPFHAGRGWQAMELGLSGMSALLAR